MVRCASCLDIVKLKKKHPESTARLDSSHLFIFSFIQHNCNMVGEPKRAPFRKILFHGPNLFPFTLLIILKMLSLPPGQVVSLVQNSFLEIYSRALL